MKDDWSEEYVRLANPREHVPERFERVVRDPAPGIGSPILHEVHRGKVTELIKDYPSRTDRRIEGLAWEFKPSEPNYSQMKYGPWKG